MELSASSIPTLAPPPLGVPGEVAFAAFLYYREARSHLFTPADFAAWLDTLPTCQRAHFAAQSLPVAQAAKSFKRFLLETRGLPMADYMAARLSSTAFAYWQATADEQYW